MNKKLIGYRTSQPFPEMMRFDITQYDWYQSHWGGILPSRYSYQRESMVNTELRAMTKFFTIDLKFDDGSIDRIVFDKGTVWDLASVPSFVRSLIDNDALIVFLAALFHDGAIGLHLYPVDMCNEIFRDLIVIFIDKYKKRYIEMQEEILHSIDDRKKRELFKDGYTDFIDKWVRDSKRDADTYFFGVDVRVSPCYKIYKNSNPETHWNRNFVKKVIVL